MPIDMITTENNSGSKKKTPCQLQALENYYSEEKYPTQTAMEEYAASLNLTYKQIRTWFVERRRKERRENVIRGYSKSLLGDQHKCSSMKSGKKTKVNTALCRSGSKTTTYSKYSKTLNQESDQSMDSTSYACGGSYGLKKKRPTSRENTKRSSSKEGYIRDNTSAKFRGPSSLKSNELQKKYCTVSNNHQHAGQKKHHICPQVLLSKDYIMKRVFRKDGPPLGVEFDSLPSSSGFHTGSVLQHSCQYNQRVQKSRKVLHSPIVEPEDLQAQNVTTYGIGKGLMTVWRATNPNNVKRSSQINFFDGDAAWMPLKSSTKDTLGRASRRAKQLKLIPKLHGARRMSQEKKRPLVKGKKVPCSKDANQKKPHWTSCRLATDKSTIEQPNTLTELVDDEELELRELQAGSNPLRCSAHFASDGKHGCPLCKDLLAKFPTRTVKMRQPFCTKPWETSPEIVKKLFKVLQFLYTNAASIEICPFTVDELAQAFTDKDSMLLGKIHVALLKLLLLDVQREVATRLIPRASKDVRFLGFLHFIREQDIDVNIWSQSLNPLTWTEILRQVLVAAGFGSKSNTARREIFFKERNQMAKYGLRPHTLKSELFAILSEHGSGGVEVSELANASQIAALDLPNSKEEIENLICSTLSSDITLFEKISRSAYRLRINPDIKGKVDYQSDSEDSGSVDDSGSPSGSSNNDESDGSEELTSEPCRHWIVNYGHQHKRTGQKLIEYSEIDESCSGEACILGLMEGEYSDFSIDEKLDTLIALIDLTGACSSLRMEESARVVPTNIPKMQYHGSGAKIKKSLMDHLMLKDTEIVSEVSRKGESSTTRGAVAKEKSERDAHPMQSIYLGSDRRYNNYWLFLGPCDIIDPGHRQVYFESSEDGHWEVITTSQALNALLSALDCRGDRESQLFASINKRRAFLCQAMDDYTTTECISHKNGGRYPSYIDNTSGDGSSPISDVDNIVDSVESMDHPSAASGAIVLELGKSWKDKEQKWSRMQAFDKWVWNDFYSNLNAVKRSKNAFMDSLARCESCHDLYWRDEKHCRICHTTFELDFDLEEKYAIHVATCRVTADSCEFPRHKVLPSQLQALKAASHAIEAVMPEMALSDAWTRLAHKLWIKRLQRTSSLSEFLQVLADFVAAINEEWLCECASASGTNTAVDEIIVCFQTMPQTTSAIALWMVKLDALIAPQLEKIRSEKAEEGRSQPKRRRIGTM